MEANRASARQRLVEASLAPGRRSGRNQSTPSPMVVVRTEGRIPAESPISPRQLEAVSARRRGVGGAGPSQLPSGWEAPAPEVQRVTWYCAVYYAGTDAPLGVPRVRNGLEIEAGRDVLRTLMVRGRVGRNSLTRRSSLLREVASLVKRVKPVGGRPRKSGADSGPSRAGIVSDGNGRSPPHPAQPSALSP